MKNLPSGSKFKHYSVLAREGLRVSFFLNLGSGLGQPLILCSFGAMFDCFVLLEISDLTLAGSYAAIFFVLRQVLPTLRNGICQWAGLTTCFRFTLATLRSHFFLRAV